MKRRWEWLWTGTAAITAVATGAAVWTNDDRIATPSAIGGDPGRYSTNSSFVNWESPHVHPLDMTPDGTRLLVANTAAARLEVFDLTGGLPVWAGSVAVGLDPVAVRARNNSEAWVVNHVSDSVSIVDLTTLRVTRTLDTDDEPCDVVFAGTPQKAFVSCSQANTVLAFDLANLTAAPSSIAILGEDPRSLAVSADGSKVYAAVFESGNRSTLLGGGGANVGAMLAFPPNVVTNAAGPYGGVNPPPNSGAGFQPPIAPANLPAIPVGLIVKKDSLGRWMDDNGGDWTPFVSGPQAAASGRVVGWDLYDYDIAAVDASSLSVSYASGLMNICMGLAVQPGTGAITVVGTEATNEIRFEPNVKGTFVRVKMASVNPSTLAPSGIVDLNPHLNYVARTIPQNERNRSLGDPRALVWNSAGTKGYVSGMGSNNVVPINSSGGRAGINETIPVGEGPTGLALDEGRFALYVLNRFEGSVSVVDTTSDAEISRVAFFDPTPAAIKIGRKHLYDTHKNSGLGQAACASCHVDGRMDRLAWDLGDPSGAPGALTGLNLGFGLPGLAPASANPPFAAHHSMKGPMTTQTLQDIIGKEPLHWRGDRSGLEAFNGAFIGLQGDDTNLTGVEMQEFEDYLATITFPPNPFRNFDNTLPTSLPLPGHYTTGRFGAAGTPLPNGNAVLGLADYRSAVLRLDNQAFACVTCHTLPTGAGPDVTFVGGAYQAFPVGPSGEHHLGLVSVDGVSNVSMKIPHIRNAYEKTGMIMLKDRSLAGFGYVHDGSVDSLERFVNEPVFRFTSDQQTANMVAFMLAFSGSDLPQGQPNTPLEPPGVASKDTHAAVGAQTTLRSFAAPDQGQITLINNMVTLANTNKVGLIAKARINGANRGYSYTGGGVFQSDRSGETITEATLRALAASGSEITYTVVPKGSETRLGIDADLDGCFDGDEGVTCSCPADINHDDFVDAIDYDIFVAAFFNGGPEADFNGDGFADAIDLDQFLIRFLGGC